MDFTLNEDQKSLVGALEQMLAPYRAPLPVGSAAFFQRGDAVRALLEEGGFLDVARQEGFGAVEALLLVEQVARLPQAVEVAGSVLVAPLLTRQEMAGPVALATAPLRAPVRFLGEAATLLLDDGEAVRALDLRGVAVGTVESQYAAPLGRIPAAALAGAALLDNAEVAEFRRLCALGMCGEIIGAADAALALTVDYVKQRRQFGRAIGSFQAIQHRLAECTTMLHAARLLAYEAAWSGRAEDAAMAAGYAQELCTRISQETHQFHGAIGLTLEYPLHYWTYRLRLLQGEHGGAMAQQRRAATAMWSGNAAYAGF